MGALTTKPYAFRVRPWELQSKYTEDIYEFFFLPLKIEYRKDLLIRVLPNPHAVLPWISDLTRFSLPILASKLSLYSQNIIKFSKLIICTFHLQNVFLSFYSSFLYYRLLCSHYTNKFYPLFPRNVNNSTSVPKIIFNFSEQLFSGEKKFLSFSNFNLRKFSPSLLVIIRKFSKFYTYCFFGSYFDISGMNKNLLFPILEFSKIYHSRTSKYAPFLNLTNSLIFRYQDKTVHDQIIKSDFFESSTFSFSSCFNFDFKLFYPQITIEKNFQRFVTTTTAPQFNSTLENLKIFYSLFPLSLNLCTSDIFFFAPTFFPYNFTESKTYEIYFSSRFIFSFPFSSIQFPRNDIFSISSPESFSSIKQFFLTTQYDKLYIQRANKLKTSFI